MLGYTERIISTGSLFMLLRKIIFTTVMAFLSAISGMTFAQDSAVPAAMSCDTCVQTCTARMRAHHMSQRPRRAHPSIQWGRANIVSAQPNIRAQCRKSCGAMRQEKCQQQCHQITPQKKNQCNQSCTGLTGQNATFCQQNCRYAGTTDSEYARCGQRCRQQTC